MRFAFEGVWSVIKSIGGSFTDVWSNGTGEQISEHLLGIWTNINNTIGYVSRNFPPLGLIAVVQKLFRTFLIFLMIYSTQLKT